MLWLWFTVLFANFAEAVAEGRGKAQADTLRKTRTETRAKRILMPNNYEMFEGVLGRRAARPATWWSAKPATSSPATAT